MQFILTDFICNDSTQNRDRKELNELDFGIESEGVLCR